MPMLICYEIGDHNAKELFHSLYWTGLKRDDHGIMN
jgi:hypothetical protein